MKFQIFKKFPQKSAAPLAKNIGLSLMLIGASATTTAQEMFDLGALGGSSSSAYAASANGALIVGDSYLAGDNFSHAFRYTDGVMTDLGTLGGNYSAAYGVSADGTVIVGISYLAGDNNFRAFRYANGVMVDIGTLGGSYSSALAISANGLVIVGQSALTGNTPFHAFRYNGGVMTDLGTLGGNNSSAFGVSADGAVIVGESVRGNDGATHAFRYAEGVMTDLGTLGGIFSTASGVSANGAVVVGMSYLAGDATYRAFRHAAGVMTDLGTLGGDNSYATGISADGTIIFGASGTANGESHAFIYRNNMVDVSNTYVALGSNGQQLNGLLNLRHSLLGVALNDDCSNYGNRKLCVSVGGRSSSVDGNAASAAATAGTLQLGYRISPQWRVGAMADQGLSTAGAGNYAVRHTQPLMAAYAVYAPSGSALGLQLKASIAYGMDDVSITRTALANTEAGLGQSSLSARGVQLEAALGLPVQGMWQATPFAGIKSTALSRAAYTETSGADFPISYRAVRQSATTAYAGIQGMATI